MSRKKQTYYRVIVDGETYGIMKLDDARKFVFKSFENAEDECEIVTTKVKLTEKQFKSLPEIE